MYTAEDLLNARGTAKKWSVIFILSLAATIGLLCAGCAVRSFPLAIAGSIAGSWIVLFIGDLFLRPAVKYKKFLLSMQSGLSRDAGGTFVSLSQETEEHDGATVRVLRIDEGDGKGERVLYINASKPFPAFDIGTQLSFHCCGRHVISYTVE